MSRRKAELFNLSFLDLLTSALGAVIFLFIITPKGGAPAAQVQQAAIYLDTAQMRIFGSLHDSLRHKQAGDTLLALLVDYQAFPAAEKPERKPVIAQREEPAPRIVVPRTPPRPPERSSQPAPKPSREEKPSAPPAPEKAEPAKKPEPEYRGDAPSVPCAVSFELTWRDANDNVDLFVCRGDDCVYGGRKRDRQIGDWDSGKSRNRLFGNDLRTNQEAVRQFDQPIPGTYKIYAQFKDSDKNNKSVTITGLIYTKGRNGQERGKSYNKTLQLGAERTLLGTVRLQEDGNFQFTKN